MVNSLLFKWEDSQALKHHCGFCERPLNHPGARASCFGKHSEPCMRFHQAMFMRLRGHTCQYCQAIDEAHYKRHHDIAEQLRAVYESCGEVDWTIVPTEPEVEERGRAREPGDSSGGNDELDRSLTPEDTPSSKRERKDAKRLARAASRSRVITQDEIRYIDSVVHSSEGISSHDNDGPRNPEEVEEIEKQLRYHAHVYNTQPNRRGLKRLAEDPAEIDIDFTAEMDRILETFRIVELLKRNTKTKGLLGKELKTFLKLVDDFTQTIIEDIVQVKKDGAEVRMRRAGFLRYTNMTSYRIVEERYTTKDWKTGEKFLSNASDSSGVVTPDEEVTSPISSQEENQSPHPRRSILDPDMRHLENTHKRITGEDGLYRNVLDPYDAPLLPAKSAQTPIRGAAVLVIKASERSPVAVRSGRRRDIPQQAPDGWQTVTNGAAPTTPVAKPHVWDNVPDKRPSGGSRPGPSPSLFTATSFPTLSSTPRRLSNDPTVKAPAVQAASAWASNVPDSFVVEPEEPENGHPAVSQKKISKKAREAKRKAKKLGLPTEPEDEAAQEDAPEDLGEEIDIGFRGTSTPLGAAVKDLEHNDELSSPREDSNADSEAPEAVKSVVVVPDFPKKTSLVPSPPPMPVTKSGKHMHWNRFKRNFVVDQLTDPCLPSWSGCSHRTSCAFETNDVPDCPFHEPHCPCVDPMADQCYLVLPCGELCTSGPYNRLRGEKLLSLYNTVASTKGRLMLVDDDLIHYFMEDPSSRARNGGLGVPDRLAKEYIEFTDGRNPGPLMEQERQFERLWSKNKLIKHQLTQKTLHCIQRNQFERAGTQYMCYCRGAVPKGGVTVKDTVVCSHRDCHTRYFHKSCVKRLGVEKVSRWYCTSCEYQMKVLARQTLRDLGFTDIPAERFDDERLEQLFEQKLDELMDMPEEQYQTILPPSLTKKLKEFGGMQAMPEEFKKQLRQKIRGMGGLGGRIRGISALGFDV